MSIYRAVLTVAILALASSPACAMPKAYEVITYTAKVRKPTFTLHYADGYLGASDITVVLKTGKHLTLHPEDGAPDDGQKLVFTDEAAQAQVVLGNLDESLEAPLEIRGSYALQGHQGTLVFKRR